MLIAVTCYVDEAPPSNLASPTNDAYKESLQSANLSNQQSSDKPTSVVQNRTAPTPLPKPQLPSNAMSSPILSSTVSPPVPAPKPTQLSSATSPPVLHPVSKTVLQPPTGTQQAGKGSSNTVALTLCV